MSTQEVFVQHFAQLFDHYQQALTSDPGETVERHPIEWNALPADERNRMVAAARLAIMEMEANLRREDDHRKYFAKPGEAEWGC
jgi:hypothetical protein